MVDRIHAFRLLFGVAGATFTDEEYVERRDALRREASALIPAVGRLTSSRLVDRLGTNDERLALYFDLELTGQESFAYASGGAELPADVLLRDLASLRQSVVDLQKAIVVNANPHIASGVGRAAGSSYRRDTERQTLMRQYQGQALTLQFADGPMVLEFPKVPLYRFDGQVRTIGAYVSKLLPPGEIQLAGIRYEGQAEPAAISLGKKRLRYALLPPGERGKYMGLLCSAAAHSGRRVILNVKTALDFLSDRISHFEVERIKNQDELCAQMDEFNSFVRGKAGGKAY